MSHMSQVATSDFCEKKELLIANKYSPVYTYTEQTKKRIPHFLEALDFGIVHVHPNLHCIREMPALFVGSIPLHLLEVKSYVKNSRMDGTYLDEYGVLDVMDGMSNAHIQSMLGVCQEFEWIGSQNI